MLLCDIQSENGVFLSTSASPRAPVPEFQFEPEKEQRQQQKQKQKQPEQLANVTPTFLAVSAPRIA